jgi:hypothetical protein
MGDLQYLISEDIPFYIASATLPHAVLLDIIDILHLQSGKTEKILRSNDRPDIHLMVQGLTFPANSFKDLSFLISDGEDGIMGLGLDSLEKDDVMVEIDEVKEDIEEGGELEVKDDGDLDIF